MDGEATEPGGLEATLRAATPSMDDTLPGESQGPYGEAPPIRQGDRLSQFVVMEELGAGAMGVVLAAHDPDLDRRVAIKLVRPKSGAPPTKEAQIRMLREAQSMAKVTHPNVVAVHQVGFERNQLFIAMEFIDGRTLRAWAQERPRRLTEVLEAYRAAGEGLIAAHSAGLVHRDFKPDNVLVGHDGRVVVTDFGLVSIAGAGAPSTPPLTSTGQQVVDEADLSQTLTATGSAMGTPAYMAAEQHRGQEVDARADQFAFCVALWEALYGVRPFQRKTYPETVRATLEGIPDPTPERPAITDAVPKAIHRAIERGLRPTAGDRWPNMRVLLEQLRYDQGAKARKVVVGVVAAVGVGAAGLGVYAFATRTEGPSCELGSTKMAEVWNDERRRLLGASLRATQSKAADEAAEQLGTRLDAWGAEWVDTYVEACEATHVHGEQSDTLLDRRMACLERSRDDMQILVEKLTNSADLGMVSQAVATASSLVSVEHCRSDDLEASDRERVAPHLREQALAVRHDLDAALIEQRLGHMEAAIAALEALRPRAEAVGDSLLLAEVLLALGQALTKGGRAPDAESVLREAAKEAAAAGSPSVEAASWLALVDTVGAYLGDAMRAQGILAGAASAVERANDPVLDGSYARAQGVLLYMTGNLGEAQAKLEEALELFAGDDPEVARNRFTVHNALAAILGDAGKAEEALAAYALALDEAMRYYGPSHPTLSVVLNNRAMQYRVLQQPDKAREGHQAALDVLRKGVGEEHQWVAVAYEGLGILDQEQGKWDAAERNFEMALTIRVSVLGPKNPAVASSQHNIASVLLARGEVEAAVQRWVAAREIWVGLYGVNHPQVAAIDQNLGMAFYQTNDLEAAHRWYTSAIKITEAVYGPAHPSIVKIELGLAETQWLRKEYRACREHADKGLRMSEGNQQVAVEIRAALFSAKGWCVLDEGKPAEALDLFNAGRALFDGNPLGDYGRAKALHALGKRAEARKVAEATLPKADDLLRPKLEALLAE